MRGSIVKRGSTYAYVIRVRGADGRLRQKWVSGFGTKRAADRALAQAVTDASAGTYVETSRLTLGEYLVGRWLPAIEVTVKPSTFESYTRQVTAYIVPALGGVRLQALSADRLSGFYADLRKHGRANGQGLAVGSVRLVHLVLHRALRDAVRSTLIARNVADDANLPRSERRMMKVWSPAELQRFLASVEGDRLLGAYYLAATTGVRRGELLGLQWGSVDLDAGHSRSAGHWCRSARR